MTTQNQPARARAYQLLNDLDEERQRVKAATDQKSLAMSESRARFYATSALALSRLRALTDTADNGAPENPAEKAEFDAILAEIDREIRAYYAEFKAKKAELEAVPHSSPRRRGEAR